MEGAGDHSETEAQRSWAETAQRLFSQSLHHQLQQQPWAQAPETLYP